MTGIQIFLLFVIWVPIVVTLIIMFSALDCICSDDDRKVSAQITVLFAIQIIAAILACVFHVLLLPVAIASVIIMVLAIILCNRDHPLRLSDVRNYFSSLKDEKREDLESSDKPKKSHKKFWRWFWAIVALLALGYGTAFVAKKSFVLVNQGESAIKRSWGEVEPQSYGPGLVWYFPFSQDWGNEVIVFNTRPKTFDYHSVIRTKEQLKASLDYSVTCQINEAMVHVMYNKYTDIDNYKSVKIDHMMPSIMMLLTSKMSFWSLSDETSSLVTEAAQYILNDQLGADSLVAITNFYFKGYQASPEIEAKIEQIAQAHQNIELERLKLQMAKIETEKVKEEAQQTYERMAAVAKANGIEVEILNRNITNPLIAQYRVAKALEEAASKWNGSINTPNALTIMKSAGENGGGISPSIFPIMPINTK